MVIKIPQSSSLPSDSRFNVSLTLLFSCKLTGKREQYSAQGHVIVHGSFVVLVASKYRERGELLNARRLMQHRVRGRWRQWITERRVWGWNLPAATARKSSADARYTSMYRWPMWCRCRLRAMSRCSWQSKRISASPLRRPWGLRHNATPPLLRKREKIISTWAMLAHYFCR